MSKYHKYRNELIEQLGGECDKCGSKENLEFHHPNQEDSHRSGIGGWNHIFKVKNDVNEKNIKVVLLCKKCHRKIHR